MDECLRHPALPFDQFKYQSNKNKQIYVVESGNLHPACVNNNNNNNNNKKKKKKKK